LVPPKHFFYLINDAVDILPNFAFPNDHSRPTEVIEVIQDLFIMHYIPSKFFNPKLSMGLWVIHPTDWTSMPKATMHKDGDSFPFENNVWPAW
jgi:hypothetical protein